MTRSFVPSDYQRTQILGFSVTHSMWPYFYAAISNPSAWCFRWYSGGSIDHWSNPDDIAWTYSGDYANTGGFNDPNGGSDTLANVDRVILNVSGLTPALHTPGGYSNDVTEWVGYINDAVDNIFAKYPNVKKVVLQPNIGGPFGDEFSAVTQSSNSNAARYDNGTGPLWSAGYGIVRCTYTAPAIRSAIASITGVRPNVQMGYIAYAQTIDDFRDWAGHLFDATIEQAHGEAMAAFYDDPDNV